MLVCRTISNFPTSDNKPYEYDLNMIGDANNHMLSLLTASDNVFLVQKQLYIINALFHDFVVEVSNLSFQLET